VTAVVVAVYTSAAARPERALRPAFITLGIAIIAGSLTIAMPMSNSMRVKPLRRVRVAWSICLLLSGRAVGSGAGNLLVARYPAQTGDNNARRDANDKADTDEHQMFHSLPPALRASAGVFSLCRADATAAAAVRLVPDARSAASNHCISVWGARQRGRAPLGEGTPVGSGLDTYVPPGDTQCHSQGRIVVGEPAAVKRPS